MRAVSETILVVGGDEGWTVVGQKGNVRAMQEAHAMLCMIARARNTTPLADGSAKGQACLTFSCWLASGFWRVWGVGLQVSRDDLMPCCDARCTYAGCAIPGVVADN